MELILEASYKEFMKRYQKGYPFALISAYRGDIDKNTNIANNKILRKAMQDEGYDVIRVLGHYQENDDNLETMIAFSSPENEENFLRFLIYFGKKFYQNGIIFVDSSNNIWIYSTKQDSTYGSIGSRKRLDKFQFFDIDELIQLFSKRTYNVDAVKIVND